MEPPSVYKVLLLKSVLNFLAKSNAILLSSNSLAYK